MSHQDYIMYDIVRCIATASGTLNFLHQQDCYSEVSTIKIGIKISDIMLVKKNNTENWEN